MITETTLLKSFQCIFREFFLISLHCLEPTDRINILESCEQGYRPGNMRCPRLMTKWEPSRLISLECDGVDGTTSTECWIHHPEEFFASIVDSDPRITHDLVSLPDEKTYPISDHICLHMRESLRSIEDEEWSRQLLCKGAVRLSRGGLRILL